MLNSAAELVTRGNQLIARLVSWGVLAMVLIYALLVALRYGADWGSIALQESVSYLHALVFMGAAAAGLSLDQHVRVDVLSSRWSARRKQWVELAGHLLFLLPFAGFLLWAAWDYVADSWSRGETSREPGGLPYVYLLKSLILVMAVQLALQALAGATQLLNKLRGTR